MDLKDYYEEVIKTAGFTGPSEEETKEAVAALKLAAEGDESIDVDAAIEFLKTAGLDLEAEEAPSEEKVAAVAAVSEQFDLDGIEFENEDEKTAAAVAIVEGFEKVAMDADQKAKMKANDVARAATAKEEGSWKNKFRKGKDKAVDALGKLDKKMHGTNTAKKMGVSVQNLRRAGTAGAALAATAGGAAYLKSRKNK